MRLTWPAAPSREATEENRASVATGWRGRAVDTASRAPSLGANTRLPTGMATMTM